MSFQAQLLPEKHSAGSWCGGIGHDYHHFCWQLKENVIMCQFFSERKHISHRLFQRCTIALRLYRFSRGRWNPASLFSPPNHFRITRKVLLQQMWSVYLAHLPFPIPIRLSIVRDDSRKKLYLIHLAELHIQANHMRRVRVYLTWGRFIVGTPEESPQCFFLPFGLLWLTLFLLAISEKCFFPPLELLKHAAAMLEVGMVCATATCEFQNWFFKILLSWLSWLCPVAPSQPLKSCAGLSAGWDPEGGPFWWFKGPDWQEYIQMFR